MRKGDAPEEQNHRRRAGRVWRHKRYSFQSIGPSGRRHPGRMNSHMNATLYSIATMTYLEAWLVASRPIPRSDRRMSFKDIYWMTYYVRVHKTLLMWDIVPALPFGPLLRWSCVHRRPRTEQMARAESSVKKSSPLLEAPVALLSRSAIHCRSA
jgi:hypothetical protein